MKYMFLIYSSESSKDEPPKDPEEFAKWMAPWMDYTKALNKAGIMLGGDALQPIATATTVSVRGAADPVFTDGPFAETKEQLGGYYLVDCKNLDEALGWAAKCPGALYGRIEVRPIADFG